MVFFIKLLMFKNNTHRLDIDDKKFIELRLKYLKIKSLFGHCLKLIKKQLDILSSSDILKVTKYFYLII